ncbi:hypothetical protein LDENG_00169260, partial [Lucifuga dentata]
GVHTVKTPSLTSPRQQSSSKRTERSSMLLWTVQKDRTMSCASRKAWRATQPSTTTTTASLWKNTTETVGKWAS